MTAWLTSTAPAPSAADLVIWSGDPLDVLSGVTLALMEGDEISRFEDGEATFAEH